MNIMPNKTFEYLDLTTSDVAFRAYGQSLEEVFCNAAQAMFAIMFDLDEVSSQKQVILNVVARNKEALLYSWLSDLLFEAEVNGYFFSTFQIKELGTRDERYYLNGIAYGSPAKIELLQTIVKGVTFHEFSLKREQDTFVATVVVDI